MTSPCFPSQTATLTSRCVKLSFKLDAALGRHKAHFEWEALWCRPRGNLLVMKSVPLFVHDLAYADVIRVRFDDAGRVVAFRRDARQNSTLWLDFSVARHAIPIVEMLLALGCT